ncbi:hypothetical protein DAPPUDRAFT_111450 [Daphnia pulex]|uniref:Uncharacterized protein n=1 Tax=Daphnia pulex TaxID=6669 RepID=E9H973_DAPPU|nr:hypothetical protein DAPPUDRAFT_111450 [Daphnia pulex]|eukprot:EFX71753.1 hypothetical protein DAPPUDRAFT_111450 [Daphnia pulex]
MALKLNTLTEFVSKLRFNADESSDKNQSFIAVDNLIKKFPKNNLSDLENFERRFKRKVLNQELAHGNLEVLLGRTVREEKVDKQFLATNDDASFTPSATKILANRVPVEAPVLARVFALRSELIVFTSANPSSPSMQIASFWTDFSVSSTNDPGAIKCRNSLKSMINASINQSWNAEWMTSAKGSATQNSTKCFLLSNLLSTASTRLKAKTALTYVNAKKESKTKQKTSFDSLRRESESSFDAVYDTNTAKEWFETHVKPMADRVNELLMAIETLRTKNVWPRRPL